jgi:Secretion system C-terminal sorting domain
MKQVLAITAIFCCLVFNAAFGQSGVTGTVVAACNAVPLSNVQVQIDLPGINITSTLTNSNGQFSWLNMGGDPTGMYVSNLVGNQFPGSALSGNGAVWNWPSSAPPVTMNPVVTLPATPNFRIDGEIARTSSPIQAYQCVSTQTTLPLVNLTNHTNTINSYRILVYNSTSASPTLGTLFSSTAWQTGFPQFTPPLPTATGQHFVVRLQIRNACNQIENKDAWVKWNAGGLPSVTAFKVNDFDNGCVAQSTNYGNPPKLGSNSGGICENTVTSSSTISSYEVRVHESDASGNMTGLYVVLFAEKQATSLPQYISFSQLTGGPSWFSEPDNYSYCTLPGVVFKLQLRVTNECGTSNWSNSYFKIREACQGCLIQDNQDADLVLEELGSESITKNHDGLVVAPNPMQDELLVMPSVASDLPVTATWYSMDGRLIASQTLENQTDNTAYSFDVSNLTPGIYIVQVTLDGNSTMHRMIKN